MKRFTITLIFMVLFSFFGISRDLKKIANVNTFGSDTSIKISQSQLDELYKLSLNGIDLVKDNLILEGTFRPIGFSYSKNNAFALIDYQEPDSLSSEIVYEKLRKILDNEFLNDSIKITCVIYNGIIKNEKYPDGNDCISFLFKSKEFDDYILNSFPIKIENGELLFGETVVEMLKK